MRIGHFDAVIIVHLVANRRGRIFELGRRVGGENERDRSEEAEREKTAMHDSREICALKTGCRLFRHRSGQIRVGIAAAFTSRASLELKQTEIELTPQASAARSCTWPRFFLERDVRLPLVRQKCSDSINRYTAAAFHPVSRSAMPPFSCSEAALSRLT